MLHVIGQAIDFVAKRQCEDVNNDDRTEKITSTLIMAAMFSYNVNYNLILFEIGALKAIHLK